MSGLAPGNKAHRTKSGLENICLGEGLAGPRSFQYRAPAGNGCRELSPRLALAWHRRKPKLKKNRTKKLSNRYGCRAGHLPLSMRSSASFMQCGFLVFFSRSCLWLCF